jgi:hypothetical protein
MTGTSSRNNHAEMKKDRSLNELKNRAPIISGKPKDPQRELAIKSY